MSAAERTQEVVVLSKSGCHLCEVVEAEIRTMPSLGDRLKVVDIDGDSELHDRYWLRVPVVRVGGEDVFEAKMMDPKGEWRKRLGRLLMPGTPG